MVWLTPHNNSYYLILIRKGVFIFEHSLEMLFLSVFISLFQTNSLIPIFITGFCYAFLLIFTYNTKLITAFYTTPIEFYIFILYNINIFFMLSQVFSWHFAQYWGVSAFCHDTITFRQPTIL